MVSRKCLDMYAKSTEHLAKVYAANPEFEKGFDEVIRQTEHLLQAVEWAYRQACRDKFPADRFRQVLLTWHKAVVLGFRRAAKNGP